MDEATTRISLGRVVREWTRLGLTGFGGPPAHIRLLRRMCVEDNSWIDADAFESAIAATGLLPGPASTQLAIWCARQLAGPAGGIVGGICFIVPGLILIIAAAAALINAAPSRPLSGLELGAGAAVPAVALAAAWALVPASWSKTASKPRWALYAAAAAGCAVADGQLLVLVLLGSGLVEWAVVRGRSATPAMLLGVTAVSATSTWGALAWTAFKVGALSYGGGFVIIPLMRADAIHHGWLTGTQFLNAVALGQLTPGPVVQTVAVVGYGAAGVGGALAAAAIAFGPSFVMVLAGNRSFARLRTNRDAAAFLAGAGPAAIGGIAGSALPLALSFSIAWQWLIVIVAGVWLLAARRSVITALISGAALGLVAATAGAPLPH